MKFVVALFIAAKAIKIEKENSYLCSPIESGVEKLVLSEDVTTFDPKKTTEEPIVPAGAPEEGITLEEKEIDVKTLEVLDNLGESASLMIFPGILDGTQRFQVFNDQGFLSDEEGNLIDQEGKILVKNVDLATLINKEKRGEEIEMPEGLMVSIIYEEGEEISVDGEKIFELDPSAELEKGEAQACHKCSKQLGFRFEELWGGDKCQASSCSCQTQTTCHHAPICSC